MTNFAGILSLRVALRLQSRVFPAHRLKKNAAVQCTASRGYDSSFPTRYIPKKSSESDSKERSSPIRGPEENDFRGRANESAIRFRVPRADKGGVAKVVQSNQKPRDSNDKWNHVNRIEIDSSLPEKGVIESQEEVSIDDGITESSYWEMEDEMTLGEEARGDEFMKGPVGFVEELDLDKENIHEPDVRCNDKTRKDAEESAIQLLATRAYTAVELRKKLQGKRFSPAIVDAVIDDFQRRGLINDILYAETFSQSRWSSLWWGPRRIKQELLRKGVSGVHADKALRQVFESDDDSASDEGSRLGLSRDSLDRLFGQASKQWQRSQGIPIETRKSRIIRWLQYRGFNWGVTSIILRRLEFQESSETR